MTRFEVYKKLDKHKLVGVIRAKSASAAFEIVDNLVRSGVKIIEITFTTPGADKIINYLSEKYFGSDILIGAGTVIDAETARIAILNGAKFIVTPGVCLDTIKLCNRYSITIIPGIQTPTELLSVLEYGISFVKLFPSNIQTLKALRGPFENVKFMATGGITKYNLTEWLDAGVDAIGSGSELTKEDADVKFWTSTIARYSTITKDGEAK
ncbi:MAG: bifunctional 4-hydroxy-2-oxoglutarate aldolase/2-dehydro-3-deoxy-phosphogluconate aldolase [Christensenellaceae bacterium]|nr:bifunctional 4-hydroxy-2-oxoglutarate aldolase/2-dehydro-3-deoxy-phosphogluconate aldolase [Christensenellaceae bacterium]